MRKLRITKSNLTIFLTLLAVFLIIPERAHAIDLISIGAKTLQVIILWPFEVLFLPLAAAIMYLAGLIMDVAIAFSINTAYIFTFSKAIDLAWSIIRDIANIFFIFILIWISLGTIVNGTRFGTMNMLKNVVIAALLINFSLFLTKAVVDVSNIFGHWLYGGVKNTLIAQSAKSDDPVSLGGLIAARLGILGMWTAVSNNTSANGITEPQADATISFVSVSLRMITVLVTTYVFLYCAVLFIARSITILFLLVFSPIGFMGGVLPQLKPHATKWKDELLSAAIFPIAFLLMLYISLQFINSLGGLAGTALTGNPIKIFGMDFSVAQYFQYFLIIFLLLASLKIAKQNSGQMGQTMGGMAEGLAKLAVGATVAVASGGSALIARTAIGGTAARIASSTAVTNASAKSGIRGAFARAGQSTLKGVAGSSFDIRGTGVLPKEATSKVAGIDFGKIGYGKAQQKGYSGVQEAKLDADRKRADSLKATDSEKAAASEWTDAAKFNVLKKDEEYTKATRAAMDLKTVGATKLADLEAKKRAATVPAEIEAINKEIDEHKKENDRLIKAKEKEVAEIEKEISKRADFQKNLQEEEKRIVEELKTKKDPRAMEARMAVEATRRKETWADSVQKGGPISNAAKIAVTAPVNALISAIDNLGKIIPGYQASNIGGPAEGVKRANAARAKKIREDIAAGGYKDKKKVAKDLKKMLIENEIFEDDEKPSEEAPKGGTEGEKKA